MTLHTLMTPTSSILALNGLQIGLLLFALLIGLVTVIILLNYFKVWLRAKVAAAPVPMLTLIAMSIRRVPYSLIVDSRITASKAGLASVTTDTLEAHYLAGGDVAQVVLAMIAADKAGIALSIDRAQAIDL